MRIPVQLAIIFAICLAGEFLNRIVGIPLPGNIIGMVLLLILLCLKIVKLEHISTVSTVFLRHFPLFFLPPSIAILAVALLAVLLAGRLYRLLVFRRGDPPKLKDVPALLKAGEK